MNDLSRGAITRRRVHYFSGFDPRGIAHYYRLLRQECHKRQPLLNTLHVGPKGRSPSGFHQWTVHWRPAPDAADAASVETECVYMNWDDIIRQHWPRGWRQLTVAFFQAHLSRAALPGLAAAFRYHRGAFWSGVLPGAYMLATFALGGLAGGWVAGSGGAWAMVLGAMVFGLVLAMGLLAAERLGILWLLRIFAFNMEFGRARLAEIGERQAAWVEEIIARQAADPVDEVVLVAHSVGTLVVAEAADALFQDPRWQRLGAKACLLTLGQCMPFATLAPAATGFRASVSRLCQQTRFAWIDVSAKIDPLCFYRIHPLTARPYDRAHGPWPVHVGARFFQMYGGATWKKLRTQKLAVHFLYMKTPEKPGNFVFGDWLFGPQAVLDRAGACKP